MEWIRIKKMILKHSHSSKITWEYSKHNCDLNFNRKHFFFHSSQLLNSSRLSTRVYCVCIYIFCCSFCQVVNFSENQFKWTVFLYNQAECDWIWFLVCCYFHVLSESVIIDENNVCLIRLFAVHCTSIIMLYKFQENCSMYS